MTPPRITRQKRQRMTADAEYLALSDIYKEQCPTCAYCGAPGTQNDHIVSGTGGRAASLLYFDTWNTACMDCNCNKSISVAQKAIAKVNRVIQTIERLRGRNFSFEDDALILESIKKRKPGHVR